MSNAATDQWDIGHGEDYDTLVLGRIFGDPTKMCLDDVVTVQKRQLSRWLDPDLRLTSEHTERLLLRE